MTNVIEAQGYMVVLDDEVKEKALNTVRILSRIGTVRAAYVFGSQADGTADRWSDIDIAMFIDGVENWDIQRNTQAMLRVMEEAGDDVEANLFPPLALNHPERGGFAEYIIRHGMRVETGNDA